MDPGGLPPEGSDDRRLHPLLDRRRRARLGRHRARPPRLRDQVLHGRGQLRPGRQQHADLLHPRPVEVLRTSSTPRNAGPTPTCATTTCSGISGRSRPSHPPGHLPHVRPGHPADLAAHERLRQPHLHVGQRRRRASSGSSTTSRRTRGSRTSPTPRQRRMAGRGPRLSTAGPASSDRQAANPPWRWRCRSCPSRRPPLPLQPVRPDQGLAASDYPPVTIGRLVLNRNPENYFAEIEQAAFEPANMVPGIGPCPDKMLLGRLFSYPDTHRYRIGSNYLQLPINRPKAPSIRTTRTARCVTSNRASRSTRPTPSEALAPTPPLRGPLLGRQAGEIVRAALTSTGRTTTSVSRERSTARSSTTPAAQHLAGENLIGALGTDVEQQIQERWSTTGARSTVSSAPRSRPGSDSRALGTARCPSTPASRRAGRRGRRRAAAGGSTALAGLGPPPGARDGRVLCRGSSFPRHNPAFTTAPGRGTVCVIDSTHAPPGHLLGEFDAVAFTDLSLLLQVLRLRATMMYGLCCQPMPAVSSEHPVRLGISVSGIGSSLRTRIAFAHSEIGLFDSRSKSSANARRTRESSTGSGRPVFLAADVRGPNSGSFRGATGKPCGNSRSIWRSISFQRAAQSRRVVAEALRPAAVDFRDQVRPDSDRCFTARRQLNGPIGTDASAATETGAPSGLQRNDAPSFEASKLGCGASLGCERTCSKSSNQNGSVGQKLQHVQPND